MKYKVRDKVIIQRGKRWNDCGLMDKWIGKIMTIDNVCNNTYGIYYEMIEDANDNDFNGWLWYEDMIKCLAPQSQAIHIYVKGNETHALLKQDKQTIKESVAKCNPADEFSLYEGAKLALDRLFDREKVEIKKTDKVRFKVGDRVKCIKNSDYKHSVINKCGTIKGYENGYFSIEFDEHISGHSCRGLTKHGYGWNVQIEDIVLINETQFELNGKTASWAWENGKYYLQGK